MNYRYYFTITAGRTGTRWLARFLGDNLGITAVHEPMAIDDFGLRMPDIKLMRTFNDRGNTALVQDFYAGRFAEISAQPAYAETNHTLAKCGLVENLSRHPMAQHACLIILRRDIARQCMSYLTRRDFHNLTVVWQWYLHYGYRNIIVNPDLFRHLGNMGQAVWYAYEMSARQLYYKSLYSGSLYMVDCRLDEVGTPAGGSAFLRSLGVDKTARLPPPENLNKVEEDPEMAQRLVDALGGIDCNVERSVADYIRDGRRLDGSSPSNGV
jgi:hypothetical protein